MISRLAISPAGPSSGGLLFAGLFLAALYSALVLPGVVAALFVQAELGTLRLGLDWPLARALSALDALDGTTIAALPVLDLDLAQGLPVSRSYTVSLAQLALSGLLAALIAWAGARALASGARMLGLAALAGVPIAIAPGLLGHCAGEGVPGGLFLLLGLDAENAAAIARTSPWLQGLYGIMLVTLIIRRTDPGRLLENPQ